MRNQRWLLLALLISWAGFFGWAYFERPQGDVLERAERLEDSIPALVAENAALAALVASQALTIDSVAATYSADSARWAADRETEARVRLAERQSLRQAADSLRSIGDSTVQALVAEMETAHAEIVRSFELEIGVLEEQVLSLEEQRALLFGHVGTLQEQVATQAIIIANWEEVNRLKDEHIGRAERQKWYERTAAVIVIGCSLLCPG